MWSGTGRWTLTEKHTRSIKKPDLYPFSTLYICLLHMPSLVSSENIIRVRSYVATTSIRPLCSQDGEERTRLLHVKGSSMFRHHFAVATKFQERQDVEMNHNSCFSSGRIVQYCWSREQQADWQISRHRKDK